MNMKDYWIFTVEVSCSGKISRAEAFVQEQLEAKAKEKLALYCAETGVGLIRYTKKGFLRGPHHDPRFCAIFAEADSDDGVALNILNDGAIDPRNN